MGADRTRAAASMAQARDLAHEALGADRGVDATYPISVCDRAIALLEPLDACDLLADLLRWKGTMLRDSGNHQKAQELYTHSLAVADSIGYTAGRAHALNCFGTIAQCRGDLETASSWYRSAKQLAEGLHDRALTGMIEQNLAIAAASAGRQVAALDHFRVALDAFEAIGNQRACLWVLNNLGNLYTRQRSYDLAADALRRAQAYAERLGDVASEGIVEENRARLFLAIGRLEEAEDAATRALGIAAQRMDRTRQAAAITVLARAKRHQDRTQPEIRPLLEMGLQLIDSDADAELRAEILREISDVYQESGDVEQAASCRAAARTLGLVPSDVASIAGNARDAQG